MCFQTFTILYVLLSFDYTILKYLYDLLNSLGNYFYELVF